MQEIWKDIKGYEGFYQVSNLGNVKSTGFYKCIHNVLYYKKCNKLLSPNDNGYGYNVISLMKKGKRKSCYIHRLVAEAFIPNPNNEKEVNHKDENKKNNVVDNLEWCNRSYNYHYSKHKLLPLKFAKNNTGERYITYRASKKLYRVIILQKEYGNFRTLEEAINKRNQVLKEVGLDDIFNITNK